MNVVIFNEFNIVSLTRNHCDAIIAYLLIKVVVSAKYILLGLRDFRVAIFFFQ